MNAVMKMDAGLVRYEAMCTAIAECHRVDEVKDIRDKARALEVYAQQAKNTDAERKAADIRLRAERRAGELLADLARADYSDAGKASGEARANVSADGTRSIEPRQSDYARALEDNGMSRQQAHRYQQLAAVPAETFEAALADPVAKPSAARIVREARDPVPQLDDNALRIWGNARDFERQRDAQARPAVVFPLMTETMQDDMRRLVPAIADYWRNFEDYLNESA